MGEFEQLQRQFVAINRRAADVVAPHQAVEHAVDFVGRPVERLGDLRLAQPILGGRQQLEDVEALVERRRAILVEILSYVHRFPNVLCRP